jgi:uncharacterized LabA/DUF88 family protein
MTETAIILIDCGYFDKINQYVQNTLNKKVSFEKLSKKITEGRTHIRTKIYHAPPYQTANPTDDEKEKYRRSQEFFKTINRIPKHQFVKVGRVKPVPVHCPKCNQDYYEPKQKGVDVAIALDLVKMALKKTADIFILISGDEDLSDAVEMAQEGPCNVIIYYCYDSDFKMYCSQKLRDTASDRVQMDLQFLDDCTM